MDPYSSGTINSNKFAFIVSFYLGNKKETNSIPKYMTSKTNDHDTNNKINDFSAYVNID